MYGAYKWLVGWSTARSGNVSIPTIGSRPRRLAGVPEEAPADAKTPPGMEVLRHSDHTVIADEAELETASTTPRGFVSDAEATVAPDEAELPDPAMVDQPEAAVAEEDEDDAVAVVTDGGGSGVEVAEINHGGDDSGEFVIIANAGPNPVSLEGWKLTDEGEKHVYEFAALILETGNSIRVHMWRGEDSETDLYVGRRNRWWNDTGDTAYLYDAAGTLVHSLYSGPDED